MPAPAYANADAGPICVAFAAIISRLRCAVAVAVANAMSGL